MKPTIKYGLISGVFAGSWMFVQFMTGVYKTSFGSIAGSLFYILLLFCIFIGVRETRDKLLNGLIDIKTAVSNGLQVAAVSAVVHAIITYIYWVWVPSDFYVYLVDTVKQVGAELKKSPEEIAEQLEQLQENLKPFRQATLTIFNSMIPGIFGSILFAFILKKP